MTGALIDVFKKEAFALKRCVRLKKSLNYKNRLMSRRHVGNCFLNLKKNVWHLQKNVAVNVNTTSRTCAVQQFPVYDEHIKSVEGATRDTISFSFFFFIFLESRTWSRKMSLKLVNYQTHISLKM